MEHHLAAILSADAAGYTRLLAEDQAATIRALGEARERFTASVERHRGRVIDTAGDNVLAELPSALDAVCCGLEVQRALADAAAALPPERRLLFRIGLHLGDIASEADRIYGDGVNVAARLQTLAEPGGICLSAAIHDNVQGRLDLSFHDLGEQSLKNFPRPVRAFRIGGAAGPPAPPEPPDRPSLVVLPFVNVSGDAEQEYFADGMSEDLITELARIPGLFVIGRGTSFAYKGKSVDARVLGRELGVRHLVEGSVRRAGARVRITARLTEARSGREVWSERYDRELGDVFALQDEVVGGVVAELRRALAAGIEHTPRERAVRPEVWELLVQGRAQTDLNSFESQLRAQDLLQRCVALDPELALAWVELARSEYQLALFNVDHEANLERGLEHVQRALALDPDEPAAHLQRGMLLGMRGEWVEAVASARRSIELAPGRPDLRLWLATLLIHVDRAEEAMPVLRSLTRLDPALRYMHLFQIAICYRRLGRIDEAIAKHRECLQLNPDFFGACMNLAAIHAQLGEMNLAREALAEVLRLRPDFSIGKIPRLPSGRDFLVENLRKTGLRE
jgi:TolB-like protein/Flp pilus assembly protein TadD